MKPTIFAISINNIINGIQLLKEHGVDQYVTFACLRLNTKFLSNLIKYLE